MLSINAVLAQQPVVQWSFDLQDNAFGNPCAADIDNDGKKEVVFSTYRNDGYIYALNSEDGSLLWKYNIGDCSDAAPIIYDLDKDGDLEVLVNSSCVPYMYCFNGKDGELEWQVQTRATDSPPSVAEIYKDEVPMIFDGDFGGYLSCFRGNDGSLVWEKLVEAGRFLQTAPVLAYIDGDDTLDIVVATYRLDSLCSIYAFRSTDGSTIWKSDTRTNSIYHGPTIADIDSSPGLEIVASDFLGFLYCFDATNGKLKWKYNFENCSNSLSPTNVADLDKDGKYEVVYYCDQYVNVLTGDGTLKWRFKMINGISAFRGGITTDVNNDGILDIVFGNYLGELTAISGKDGKLIWIMDYFDIYGKNFDVSSGLLASDFNQDGLIDIFFVGGWTHADYTQNYGRAYMISTQSKGGPDWLMFGLNHYRNNYLEITPTSIQSEEDHTSIIYPNPASEYIEISFDSINPMLNPILNPMLKHGVDFGVSEIKIYNSYGECVISDVQHLEDVGHLKRIDISHLPFGLYIIHIGNCTEKFVVVR